MKQTLTTPKAWQLKLRDPGLAGIGILYGLQFKYARY